MLPFLSEIKPFHSPYAPQFQQFCAFLAPPANWEGMVSGTVAGKGYNSHEARMRLLGEAAERVALVAQPGDEFCPTIDATGHRTGTVPADQVRCTPGQPGLGTSGCSAHNFLTKAIENSVFELIERRDLLDWWTAKAAARRLGPATLQDNGLNDLVRHARSGAREPRETRFHIIDTPGPVVTAIASSRAADGSQIAAGYAARPGLSAACARAFLELLSVELEVMDLTWARIHDQPINRDSNRGLTLARQQDFAARHDALFPDTPFQPQKTNTASPPLTEVLSWFVDSGQTIQIADLTRPGIGLPACRAYFENPKLAPAFPQGFALSPV